MNVLEKEIEEMIWQGIQSDRPLLRSKGLYVWDNAHYLRQFDFGSYGISDIIGIQIHPKQNGIRYIDAHIIEIKKEEVNSATLLQAIRYAKAIIRIVTNRFTSTYCNIGISLVGKSIDLSSDFVYLPDIIENVALYTYSIDYKEGILFKRHQGYKLNSENLPDVSRYKKVAKELLSACIKKSQITDEMPF